MTHTNHTAGTWKNQTMGGDTDGRQILRGKLHVATCHYGNGIDVDEATANSRLIAAAPAMYEALKEMVDMFNSYAHCIKPDKGFEVIQKAVDAISKAEAAT
jgi:hypothetical protein